MPASRHILDAVIVCDANEGYPVGTLQVLPVGVNTGSKQIKSHPALAAISTDKSESVQTPRTSEDEGTISLFFGRGVITSGFKSFHRSLCLLNTFLKRIEMCNHHLFSPCKEVSPNTVQSGKGGK